MRYNRGILFFTFIFCFALAKSQNNTLSVDTTSIIKDIKKKYTLITKNRNSAKTEVDYKYTYDKDTSTNERPGDDPEITEWDTTFYISKDLTLRTSYKYVIDNGGRHYYLNEDYFAKNILIFNFYQEIREYPGDSYIRETRKYYYNSKPIKCLFRELFNPDISVMRKGIDKIVSKNCITK